MRTFLGESQSPSELLLWPSECLSKDKSPSTLGLLASQPCKLKGFLEPLITYISVSFCFSFPSPLLTLPSLHLSLPLSLFLSHTLIKCVAKSQSLPFCPLEFNASPLHFCIDLTALKPSFLNGYPSLLLISCPLVFYCPYPPTPFL